MLENTYVPENSGHGNWVIACFILNIYKKFTKLEMFIARKRKEVANTRCMG